MQPIILDVEAVAIADVDTYLEPVSAPSNYKDEAKIAEYQREKRAELVERAALDVDLAQIVCIGMTMPYMYKRPHCEVMTAEHHSEHDMLARVWHVWRGCTVSADGSPILVTFNGLNYDVPMLLRRSLYLGIPAPYIQCDRFRHPQILDLQAILSMDGKLKWRGLQFFLNRFGYPGGGPDITGADIAARYQAGDWAAIEQHCRMDIEATAWLAERIGAVPKRQQVGQQVEAGAF